MRSRSVVLLAIVLALATAAYVISRFVTPSAGAAALPQSPAAYLGVYETGAPHTYQPVADFTQVAGRQPNLVGYYSTGLGVGTLRCGSRCLVVRKRCG